MFSSVTYNSGSDSVCVEIDDLRSEKPSLVPVTGTREWKRADPFLLDESGLHTIKMQRRERDAGFDKIVVTPDLTYVPTGTGSVTRPNL